MSKNNDKKDGYKVGYGKPPKSTRFGAENGNPRNTKGRPPGRNVLEFDRLSEEALWHCFHESAQMSVPFSIDGEVQHVPMIMAITKKMAKAAADGDKHARKEFLKYLEKAAKGKDQLVVEMQSILASFRDRRFEAMQKPGSLQCFHSLYGWFRSKKHLRAMDGNDRWPYEDDEPITDEDWAVFMRQYEYLKNNPSEVFSWPPPYPTRLEEERYENMTEKERIREHYELFKHRKEMREKQGVSKWPYMVEEPVDDEDWKHFEKHIQDRLDGKEPYTPWPPAYWNDDPEEET